MFYDTRRATRGRLCRAARVATTALIWLWCSCWS